MSACLDSFNGERSLSPPPLLIMLKEDDGQKQSNVDETFSTISSESSSVMPTDEANRRGCMEFIVDSFQTNERPVETNFVIAANREMTGHKRMEVPDEIHSSKRIKLGLIRPADSERGDRGMFLK